ncbi:MAG: TVP38/TMEM64 family protein [Ruminococcus sp.]|nr:TVP38/TMEM64 family protein [Ruminococcus sp.]
MKNKINKDSLKYRIVVFIMYFAVLVGLTVALIPLARLLMSKDGMEKFHNILESYKFFSVFVFLFVQAVQVVVVLIPPVQIVGGMLFGGLWGSLLSLLGLWLGSAVVFLAVKTAGKPLVEAIISKKNVKKFRFLEDTDKITVILFVLYLIPGTPKDAITYIVPLTKIDIRTFLLGVLPARIPSVVISAFFGNSIYKENYVLTAVFGAVIVALAIFGFVFREKAVSNVRKFINRKKIVENEQNKQ